jgi:ankyrin
MVDARGGAMKGCRHSGVRVIIPPKRASMPTRITCRFVRKEKLAVSLPLNEGEALAARVLEMGPHGYKFLGPVLLEIPHYGSLRGKEREIVVLRSDSGEKWYEHPIVATESAVEEALGCTLELNNQGGGSGDELAMSSAGGQHNDDTLSTTSTSKLRITRIITNDFPKYFALVSRVRHETHAVSEQGGVISSTIVPKAQAVFPEKALQKKIKLSLQAMPIPYELVAKLFGNRVAVSPIVTIEPRRRKFHKAITLTIPLPKSPLKGMINSYNNGKNGNNNDSYSLRLLCSITGGLAPAQWEDITGHTPLSYFEECVSFTTTVSARFWLMDCQNVNEATRMATELYREAISVPFMSRFIVYAKRHDLNEAKLRVYCITDDKEEKTLELRENFLLVAKSKEVEILENRTQWLEMGGNIAPVSVNKSSGEQLSVNFQSFVENRLPFVVRIRDLEQQPPTGRLVFLKDPKNATLKSDVRSPPVCTLDIQLPPFNRELIEHDEMRKRNVIENGLQFTFLNGSGTLTTQAAKSTTSLLYSQANDPNRIDFNLRLLANDLNNAEGLSFDWSQLASRLGLSSDEIDGIRHMSSSSPLLLSASPANQTFDMLTAWMNKFSTSLDFNLQMDAHASPGDALLRALRDMGVDEELIQRNITSNFSSSAAAVAGTGAVHTLSGSNTQAENIYSVEKSLAKLNLNLNCKLCFYLF